MWPLVRALDGSTGVSGLFQKQGDKWGKESAEGSISVLGGTRNSLELILKRQESN